MKPEELQIGDWIQTDNTPFKVVGFDTSHGEVQSDDWIIKLECCNPIQLTPEILEKNGFVIENGEFVFDFYDGRVIIYNRFDYNLRIVENYKTILDITEYREIEVHKLQHALRICGISKEIIL